jgi:hypothetical protein
MNDIQRAKEDFKKLSFTEKLEHIWFYYKWFILLGAAVASFTLVCLTQCATRKDPDAMIMYVGPYATYADYVGSVTDALEDVMSEDYDGNGYKAVGLLELPIAVDSENKTNQMAIEAIQNDLTSNERLYIEMTAGTSIIYLVDPHFYDYFKSFLDIVGVESENDFLMPLEQALGYLPENAYDDYGIQLSALPCYENTNMKYMSKDAILCIRNKRQITALKKDKDEFFEANLKYFADIVNWLPDIIE